MGAMAIADSSWTRSSILLALAGMALMGAGLYFLLRCRWLAATRVFEADSLWLGRSGRVGRVGAWHVRIRASAWLWRRPPA
jgi:hypothetical protein